MKSNPAAVLTMVAVVVGLALSFTQLPSTTMNEAGPGPEARQRPNIPPDGVAKLLNTTLPDHANRPQPMSQWAGKVLVVNFWATWCPPCRAEMPDFSRLNTEYTAKGVQFVGVGIDSPSAIKEFALQFPVSYPLLIAGTTGLELTDALGNLNGALPHTIVFDREGKPFAERLGRWEAPALEAILRSAIN
jgi:thiol-disulfide isomerase/thioredoxin